MTALLLLVSLAAAQAPAASTSAVSASDFAAARRAPNWLKPYPVTPFREFWRGELQVKSLEKALPALSRETERFGASLTNPLSTFVSSVSDKSQQLTISVPQAKAGDFLKVLRKLGTMPDPAIQAGLPRPDMKELRGKIDALIAERVTMKTLLEKLPASAGASDEVLEQLLNAEAMAKRTPDTILLNLTVREAP